MAADLHIHVLEGVTEDDLRVFFRNTLGSKYFGGFFAPPIGNREDAHDKVAKTPSYWIGEVSWLKAALVAGTEGDDSLAPEEFIPDPVQAVHEIVGEELPVVDDELIAKLCEALGQPNTTGYSVDEDQGGLRSWLEKYRGKQLFTVSW